MSDDWRKDWEDRVKVARKAPSPEERHERILGAIFGANAVPAPRSHASHLTILTRGRHTIIDNPRLVSVRTHKPPEPRGHRRFIGKESWR